MENVYSIFQKLDISYEKIEHPAVYTVEEADKHYEGIDAGRSKNLFLRNEKGSKQYLVVIESSKTADLKLLASLLHEKKLSFASPERLEKYLRLTPGSVSPFGLINDTKNEVSVVVDSDLLRYEKLSYHPNINTATLVITTKDFKKFLDWTTNPVQYVSL